MRNEIVIKNWLAFWLRPELITEINISARPKIIDSDGSFGKFISFFKNEKNQDEITTEEKETLKGLITRPLAIATGYPANDKEAIRVGTIYIISGGWSEIGGTLGGRQRAGNATTHIAVSGGTVGGSLNMAEPSLLIQLVTSLLISGRNYFTSEHMTNQVVSEATFAQDEQNSHAMGFAMRSSSISYNSDRHGVVTYDFRSQEK